MHLRVSGVLSVLAIAAFAGVCPAEPPVAGEDHAEARKRFTDEEELHQLYVRGVRLALNWQNEESRAALDEILRRDPDQPAGYYFLGALMLNTIQYHDQTQSGKLESEMRGFFETAIQKADKLLKKNPDDFQANFFKGASLGFRAIFRLRNLRILAAASDARVAKACMEKSVALEPTFYDAYLGLGMYNYFVDALPSVVKFLKALLFIPPGDREKGVAQIVLATEKGTYCGTYAKVILSGIYHNFESEFEKGCEVEKQLARECPDHPWYALERGSFIVYMYRDLNWAEAHYRGVLARAKAGHPHFQGEIAAVARYRLANVKFLNFKPEEAISDLETLITDDPKEPIEIVSGAHLLLGEIYFALGQRELGREHLKIVRSLPDSRTYRHERMENLVIMPQRESLHNRAKALLRLEAEKAEPAACRLNCAAFSLLRSKDYEGAAAKFTESLQQRRGYGPSVLGLGEANARLGRDEEALKLFTDLGRKTHIKPSWLVREAYFRAGLLLDRMGRREEAIQHYGMAVKAKRGNMSRGVAARKAMEDKDAWREIGWPEL